MVGGMAVDVKDKGVIRIRVPEVRGATALAAVAVTEHENGHPGVPIRSSRRHTNYPARRFLRISRTPWTIRVICSDVIAKWGVKRRPLWPPWIM